MCKGTFVCITLSDYHPKPNKKKGKVNRYLLGKRDVMFFYLKLNILKSKVRLASFHY